MTSVLLAAGLAACAVLATGSGRPLRPAPGPAAALAAGRLRRRGVRRAVGVPRTAWAVLAVMVVLGPPALAAASLVAGSVLVVVRRRAAHAAADRTRQVAALVADGATALAADLTAGHAPLAALAALAAECAQPPTTPARIDLADRLQLVASTGRLGGDVPAALRTASTGAGATGLRELAAGWQVAECTGAGLAAVLEHVAAGLRRQQVAGRQLAGSLAAARASARLLVALPVLGLLIGAGLGVSPAHFLLGPPAGRICLVAGLALSALGVWWTDRLADQAAATARP